MARLLDCLRPDGEIILATNIRDYFEEAIEFATREWRLDVVRKSEIVLAGILLGETILVGEKLPRTHFEKSISSVAKFVSTYG